MTLLTFQPVFGSGIAAAFLILLILGAIFLFPIKRERLAPFRRRLLLVFRMAALFVLTLILMRPTFETEETRRLPATLAILVDSSESMGVRDQSENRSRFESVRAAMDQIAESGPLPDDFTLSAFEFDEGLRSLSTENGRFLFTDVPRGVGTEIGGALDAALAQSAGKRLLGTILLSDGTGRNRRVAEEISPVDVAFRYRDAGIPIYPICVGSTDNVDARRDAAVVDVNAPRRVFVQNELVVAGQIQAVGFKGKTLPLSLLFEDGEGKMTLIEKREIVPDSDDAVIPYRFSFRPDTPGERKLVVAVAPQEGEILVDNNVRNAFIQVVEGGVSVLLLEGSRRFEDKFLRMALESTAEIRVDYWRPAVDGMIRPEGKTETERIAMMAGTRKPLTDSPLWKKGHSVLILGNLDADSLKTEELTAIEKRVTAGTGLIALGGERSLSAGGYAATPLVDLFPVTLDPDLRLPMNLDAATFDQGRLPEERIYRDGSFRIRPTEIGTRHYLGQLNVDRTRNREIWDRLPPLTSVLTLGAVKPGALTILEGVPESGKGNPVPILAAQLYGSGRVTVLAADSTWKWGMGGFREEFQKFWRQMILWSASEDELKPGEMRIQLDQPRFFEEEAVDFQVVYKPTPETPPGSLHPEAVILTPDRQEIPIPLTGEGETFAGLFDQTVGAGDYRIHVQMKDEAGHPVKSADARFSVWTVHRELENPVASPAVMKNLAEVTGGRALFPEELPSLISELARKKETLVDVIRIRRTFYDRWPVFITFILLLTAEWFLRKKWGMV